MIVNIERGNLSFRTISGESLLNEGNSIPRTYEPVELNGDHTYRVTDRFSPSITEALYGLGQHQNGMFNYRGATVELGQNNTDVAIPLLISSKGYGLMWNTAALTYFDNRFPLDMKLTSIAGKSIDYYFLYGPEIDAVLHEYRTMTGHAPMLPKWAYGFFQSKDRYVSLDEIRGIAQRYRQEHIPLDAMVQDWFWWKTEGDPVFNSNYHDVAQDLDALHKENVHAMISVWGLLDPKSETYKILDAKHELVSDAHVYDATNPEARDIYWQHLPGKLLAQGWDAFWLDSAEPEEYWPHMGDAILSSRQIAIGNGAEFTNVFPFAHTLGVQDHWKAQNPGKRVFLLTRSAFLGQQRVGATVWSGDVYGTYWGLSHQVPAGLNFALSGSPYWTTDIGGYWPPHEDPLADPAFQELYARWFEYGTFCPIFRTHGHRPHNELWSFDKVEPILVSYDKLRYRLMPYIYSLGLEGNERGLHHPAPARDGLAHATPTPGTSATNSCSARPSWSIRCSKPTRPNAASTCRQPLHGTTSGPANRSQAGRRSKPMRRSIVFRSSCAPVPSFPWARRSNTPRRIPQGRSSFAFIAAPMANSIFMKTQAMDTSTRRASIPSSQSDGTITTRHSPSAHGKAHFPE